MSILPSTLKQWLERKRKHHQQAIDDYCFYIRASLEKHLERRIRKLNARSITISVDASKAPNSILRGLTLDRESLPGVKLFERVHLVDRESKKQLASGLIVHMNASLVKVKLEKPLKLLLACKHSEQDENKTNQATGSDGTKPSESVPNLDKTNQDQDSDKLDNNNDKKKEDNTTTTTIREFDLIFYKKDIFERVQRIEQALQRFKNNDCSIQIQRCLLGYYNDWTNVRYSKSRLIIQPELVPQPSGYQRIAIEQAMRRRIALIEGVAGSGKTLVAANIACSMSSLRKKKILLCSPIQATIDKLVKMIKIVDTIKLVKLSSDSQWYYNRLLTMKVMSSNDKQSQQNRTNLLSPAITPANSNLLDDLVEANIYKRAFVRSEKSLSMNDYLKRNEKLLEKPLELHNQAQRAVKICSKWLKKRVEHQILSQADIVCCTLFQAGSKCLKDISFDMLIIDDAHLTTEADCLIAMMAKGIEQITLLSEMRRDVRMRRSSMSFVVSSPSISEKSTHYQPNAGQSRSRSNSIKSERITIRRGRATSTSRNRTVSSTMNSSITNNNNSKRQRLVRRASDRYVRVCDNDSKQNYSASKQEHLNHMIKRQQAPTAIGGLFERLLSLGLSSVALKHQFRMHETIADFPKYHFYLSRLKTDQEVNDRLTNELSSTIITKTNDIESDPSLINNNKEKSINNTDNNRFSWLPNKCCLTAMFNTKSNDDINKIVLDIINKLVHKENINPSRIGVITNSQSLGFKISAFDGFEVGTIEHYFGEERDFIILSCFNDYRNQEETKKQSDYSDSVISDNDGQSLKKTEAISQDDGYFEINCNYLQNNNALNLALTRARMGLFIVADLSGVLKKLEVGSTDDINPSGIGTKQPNNLLDNDNQASKMSTRHQYCKSWIELVKYCQNNRLIA